MSQAKQITYDWDGRGRGPRGGDVLRTKTGRCWTVVSSREVRMRIPVPGRKRYRLLCVQGDLPSGAAHRVYPLVWHPRGPKR